MLASLRAAARRGLPIYAECGGLMYLQESLVDADGRRHRMAGLVPGGSTLVGKRMTLGYREVRARRDTPHRPGGPAASRPRVPLVGLRRRRPRPLAAYDVLGDPPRAEGYASGNVLASYVHLHFASDPALAPRFVEACAARTARHPSPLRSHGSAERSPRRSP